MLYRLRAVLTSLWAGVLITLGALAAPTLFQMLDKALAGQIAGRYFAQEARFSLLLVAVLLLLERAMVRRQAGAADGGARSQFSVNLALLLGVLFSVVVGYHVLQPLMELAKQGQGRWSFLQLHGVSMAFYAIRTVLVLTLAWRCAERSVH